MMATKADIAVRVLRELKIIALGETAAAEETTVVNEIIDEEHDTLRVEGYAPWELTTVVVQYFIDPSFNATSLT